MADSNRKFLELADLLEQELSAREVGSPATTLNELAERFEISRSTAKRVLLELQQRGTIYSRVGAGSFVAPQQRKKMILVVFRLNQALAHPDVLNETFLVRALIRCNLKYSGYTVSAMDFDDFARNIDHLDAMHPHLKGVVLLREIAPYIEHVEKLRRRGIPAAFYCSSVYREKLRDFDYLILDEEKIIETVLGELRARGCRKPGFAGALSFPVYQERLRMFRMLTERYGMDYSAQAVLDSEVVDLRDKKMLRHYLTEVDCVVCSDDGHALEIGQAALELGFRVPDEVAITGVNNIAGLELFRNPGITTVALHPERNAERMVDLLIRRIEHGEPFQESSAFELVKRSST